MIILTGGAGFIGSAFLWKLNKEGKKDVTVVDKLDNTDKWKNLRGKLFDDYIDKDDFLCLLEAGKFKKIDTIFHIGACSSTTENDAHYLMSNNYQYSKRIAFWCANNNIKLIYASSAATYGDGKLGYKDDHDSLIKLKPMNIYGYSKHAFDLWLMQNKLLNKFTGLKYFNVYGPNEYHKEDMMSVICKAYKQIQETGKLKLFNSYKQGIAHGEQKRDFIYIKDVLEIMYFFYKNPTKSGIYNLGTGIARSFNDLASSIFKAMGKQKQINYINMPIQIRNKYQYFTEADLGKLKKSGYKKKFYSLEEAVIDYVQNHLSAEDPYL
ncbi:MAG: ADP-glyceromanno-heptose 6-epimerase [Spirochaetes bacterium]|nr:ADP-glyceromanno-heptose 6-epimerase [Spirochaetota bacterium]